MINIDRFITIEIELSEKYGPFNLFALFLREDADDKWDVVVTSNWLQQNEQKSMDIIKKKLDEKLNKEEAIYISRIILMEENAPALHAIYQTINTEHGKAEIENNSFFGLYIKHAYIITSQRPAI